MRILFAIAASAAALTLAACESPADKAAENKADAIDATAEVKADALENKADAVDATDAAGSEAKSDALENQADAVRDAADTKGDAIEAEAGKKD